MNNISETVMMCMIAIAAIQFVIIYTIIKSGNKKSRPGYIENKKNLIDLLNSSSNNDGAKSEECC